jgi:glycine/D-amino acid oxidase-like deaminating enzyme
MMEIFDVAIIGRGVTGLSATRQLIARGVENLVILGPEADISNTTSMGARYAQITLHDNITRAAHNHGTGVARSLLNLNKFGFGELWNILNAGNVAFSHGQSLRVAATEHELFEMKAAASWLSDNGFPASIASLDGRPMQRDGAASLVFDGADLIRVMSRKIEALPQRRAVIVSIRPARDYVESLLASGEIIKSRMVVLACHVNIKSLLPVLEPSLVNHADQTVILRAREPVTRYAPGDVIYTGHSQFWMALRDRHLVVAGGARYLRKWAGVEATDAEVRPEITRQIVARCQEVLGARELTVESEHGHLDLRGCDELPVIGPMFGDSRILVGAGYMGTGITMGLAAGAALAEVICLGRSTIMDPVLFPARLRSLPDSAT